MSDTLARILDETRARVALGKSRLDLEGARAEAAKEPPARGFAAALRAARAEGRLGLIAEIKRASPSRGLIRADFDPAAHARDYAAAGATCLSVLTEPDWFKGRRVHLADARAACALPVLRKDFMIDPWQVAESRMMGADCILLIMAALSDDAAAELEAEAEAMGMDVLAEAHDADEVARALRLRTPLIGINNRDLKTLEVDPMRALDLARAVPGDRIVIAESGLKTNADLRRYADSGVSTFLVGESLMAQPDLAAATRALLTGAAA